MNAQKSLMSVLAALVDNGVTVDDNLTTAIYNRLAGNSDSKLTPETRAILPTLKGGASFDSLSDDIVIHIPQFFKATKAERTNLKVEKHDVTITLPSYDVETVRYFSLAMGELITRQPDYSVAWNNEAKLTALVDFVIPVLQGQDKIETAKKAESLSLSFDYTEYGLDPSMFASGNKSVYNLPKNGGIKVYLKHEFKRQFDDLCEEGLLDEVYGRNLVKEGEFQGFFAVVIPVKK